MPTFTEQLQIEIPALRRYARSLLHDALGADDLVQESLARALEKQTHWQAGSDLRAWLFTLMHNLFVNQMRKAQRQPLIQPYDERQFADTGSDQLARTRQIQRQMARLPFNQREVLALVALEGFSYAEVADILNVPMGTVMSRLSRAREAMREQLYGGVPVSDTLRRVK